MLTEIINPVTSSTPFLFRLKLFFSRECLVQQIRKFFTQYYYLERLFFNFQFPVPLQILANYYNHSANIKHTNDLSVTNVLEVGIIRQIKNSRKIILTNTKNLSSFICVSSFLLLYIIFLNKKYNSIVVSKEFIIINSSQIISLIFDSGENQPKGNGNLPNRSLT